MGCLGKVSFDIDASEWQGRWFNKLTAWRIDPVGAQSFAQPAQPQPTAQPQQGWQQPAQPQQPYAQPATTAPQQPDQLPF